MGFSRQEYWSGLPFPSPGDLPDPGIEPMSPALQADALPSEPPGKPKYILSTQNKTSRKLKYETIITGNWEGKDENKLLSIPYTVYKIEIW